MYSTELESADLARDCPQCATGRLFSPLMAATSVPPLDHVRVSTRWQILFDFYFTGAMRHRTRTRWMQCAARSPPNQGNGEGVYYVLD